MKSFYSVEDLLVSKWLKFPIVIMPKLDGYRAVVEGSKVYTKSGKELPNKYIQSMLGKPQFNGLEGELIAGNTFQDCGIIRSHTADPFEFTFNVFNCNPPLYDWVQRMEEVTEDFSRVEFVVPVDFAVAHDREDLETLVPKMATEEGCMLRILETDELAKLKFYGQSEAVIVGFEVEKYGTNLKTVPPELWGQPKNRIGKLIVTGLPGTPFDGITFKVGSGLTHDQRTAAMCLWEEEWKGKPITFKYVPSGTKKGGKPRHPVFLGIRPDWDLTNG